MSETIFEKILRKEIPARVAYEDEQVLAFHDIAPQAPVHVLVIPKEKWSGFAQLSRIDSLKLGAYMASISKVATHLGLDEDGYRVVFNQGRDGQQSVAYIHAHILGGRRLSWPPG